MKRLLTKEEQANLDCEFSRLTGLPPALLMEQAASGLAGLVGGLLGSLEDRDGCFDVLIFAGSGNNGGDGWAAARQLQAQGYDTLVFDAGTGRDGTGDAQANRLAYNRLGGTIIESLDELGDRRPLVAVDALYGTGFRADKPLPPQSEEALDALAHLKARGSLIVACDIPSGLDANTGQSINRTVPADFTATFGRKKIGLVTHPGLLKAGEVFEFPISMTDDFVDRLLADHAPVYELDEEMARDPMEARSPDGHKGQFGRVLLIGGAPGMAGALILAARASEKMGVGYTMLRAPEQSMPLIAAAVPSALLSAVPEEGTETRRDLPEPDVIAIGTGAGADLWVEKGVAHILEQPMAVIIDADGLNALSRMPDAFSLTRVRLEKGLPPAILTPHPGEFLRLAPDLETLLHENRLEAARQLAARAGAIIVLKGMATVIALPDGSAFINTTGHVGLAKGGSGDVLTGMIAGLAAQYDSINEAVRRAVYLHGRAAELAMEWCQSEIAVTPQDLIDAMGEALQA